jgi:hypothetical protein
VGPGIAAPIWARKAHLVLGRLKETSQHQNVSSAGLQNEALTSRREREGWTLLVVRRQRRSTRNSGQRQIEQSACAM